MSKIKYKLKGHEKFTLREGWINKGIMLLSNDYSKVFLEKYAMDKLGVGNNMVKSIRHWLKACKLSEESAGKGVKLSDIGMLIKQYDPYIEDDFTLCVLHSNLSDNNENATVWYLFFNKCNVEEFSKDEIYNLLCNEFKKYINNSEFSKNSLRDDVDVLLNMYAKNNKESVDPEDKMICPLSGLGLIQKKGHVYTKKSPDLRMIDDMVVLYEISKFLEYQNSVSIDKISIGEGSIGSKYGISRIAINQYLDRLAAKNYIEVNRTAGLDVIYDLAVPSLNQIVENYYLNK